MANNLPGTNLIPALLTDAKVYREGTGLLGVATVELPELEFMSDSITGLGIAGEVDVPVTGHFKAMTVKIKWNTPEETAISLLKPVTHQLEIFGSIQVYDAGAGVYEDRQIKVLLKAAPKKVGLGKMEPAKKMEAETELEIYFLKIWHGGKEIIEVDKFNYIFRVLGEDHLSKIRSNLGMDY